MIKKLKLLGVGFSILIKFVKHIVQNLMFICYVIKIFCYINLFTRNLSLTTLLLLFLLNNKFKNITFLKNK